MAGDLKPPSKAARETAVEIARGHKKLGPLLADGGRVVLVAPNLHDQRRIGDGGTVVVGIYDYAKNRSLVALVDPSKNKVVGVEDIGAQFQLSDDEAREAETLAAKDARVKQFLNRRAMNPLTRLYFPPDAPLHRYAIVFLRPTNAERRYAVVDLSARKVTDLLDQLTD